MTELLSGVEAPSDAELISRVRGGDTTAYGELFTRHVDAARRLGRQLVRGPDVDDLVSEAFAKMLQVLQSGGGPDVAFRAYLLTSVRRLHVDRIRASSKVQPSDDMAKYDSEIPFQDPVVANFENGAAARAFSSLPERWQLVLWHLEVEGQKPADIAPLLGMSANSVSALAYRAREGLRQAFLTMHLADSPTEGCRWVNEHLGGYVRGGLSRRDTAKVEEHLDECRRCTAMYLELNEVNSNLAGIIGPVLLGVAAAGYLSSSSAGVGIGFTGVSAVVGRVRDVVAANAGVATGGAIAAGVAAVTTTAFVMGIGGGPKEAITDAERPIGIVQTPTTAPQSPTPAPEPRPEAPTPTPSAVAPALAPVLLPTPEVVSETPAPTDLPAESPIESPVPDEVPAVEPDPVVDPVNPDPVVPDPVVEEPLVEPPVVEPPVVEPPPVDPPPAEEPPPAPPFTAVAVAAATPSGDGSGDRLHEYSVTLTLNGVPAEGGNVLLDLTDPQERFCSDSDPATPDTCAPANRLTELTEPLPVGDEDGVVEVPLVLWLPGGGAVPPPSTLTVALEGSESAPSPVAITRPPVSPDEASGPPAGVGGGAGGASTGGGPPAGAANGRASVIAAAVQDVLQAFDV